MMHRTKSFLFFLAMFWGISVQAAKPFGLSPTPNFRAMTTEELNQYWQDRMGVDNFKAVPTAESALVSMIDEKKLYLWEEQIPLRVRENVLIVGDDQFEFKRGVYSRDGVTFTYYSPEDSVTFDQFVKDWFPSLMVLGLEKNQIQDLGYSATKDLRSGWNFNSVASQLGLGGQIGVDPRYENLNLRDAIQSLLVAWVKANQEGRVLTLEENMLRSRPKGMIFASNDKLTRLSLALYNPAGLEVMEEPAFDLPWMGGAMGVGALFGILIGGMIGRRGRTKEPKAPKEKKEKKTKTKEVSLPTETPEEPEAGPERAPIKIRAIGNREIAVESEVPEDEDREDERLRDAEEDEEEDELLEDDHFEPILPYAEPDLLSRTRRELEVVKEQLKDAREQLESMESGDEDSGDGREKLVRDLNQARYQVENVTEKLQGREKELANTRNEINRLKSDLDRARMEMEGMSREMESLKNREQTPQRVDPVKERAELLEKREALEQMRRQADKLKLDLSEATRAGEALQQDLEQVKGDLQAEKQKSDHLQSELEKARQETSDLANKFKETSSQKASSEDGLQKLQGELAQVKVELSTALSDLQLTRDSLTKSQKDLENEKAAHKTTQRDAGQVAAAKGEVEKELTLLKTQQVQSLTELDRLQTQLAALKEQLTQKTEPGIETLDSSEVIQLKTELTTAQAALNKAESQLAESQRELESLKATVNSEKEYSGKVSGEIEELNARMVEQNKALIVAQESLDAALEKEKAASSSLAGVQAQADKLKAQVDDLNQKIATATSEMEAARTQAEADRKSAESAAKALEEVKIALENSREAANKYKASMKIWESNLNPTALVENLQSHFKDSEKARENLAKIQRTSEEALQETMRKALSKDDRILRAAEFLDQYYDFKGELAEKFREGTRKSRDLSTFLNLVSPEARDDFSNQLEDAVRRIQEGDSPKDFIPLAALFKVRDQALALIEKIVGRSDALDKFLDEYERDNEEPKSVTDEWIGHISHVKRGLEFLGEFGDGSFNARNSNALEHILENLFFRRLATESAKENNSQQVMDTLINFREKITNDERMQGIQLSNRFFDRRILPLLQGATVKDIKVVATTTGVDSGEAAQYLRNFHSRYGDLLDKVRKFTPPPTEKNRSWFYGRLIEMAFHMNDFLQIYTGAPHDESAQLNYNMILENQTVYDLDESSYKELPDSVMDVPRAVQNIRSMARWTAVRDLDNVLFEGYHIQQSML
ncbi:MAG: hypothetical protein H6581_28600 [Bacteroidia bacterium]|nr:hypothetical protein [Bacteroidia bacterium]